MTQSAPPTLDPSALYAKSKLYIARGLRAQAANDAEEYQLWASLALELLGKAALAGVHPSLIADPQHFQSLFAACGRPLTPDVKTITAKTLFERLGHVEKAFDARHQKFCEQISLRRNSELHSGESPFAGMSSEKWEREFWGAAEAILKMQDETLESWLGTESAEAPSRILQHAEVAAIWAVKNRIARCKDDFEQKYKDPGKRKKILEESADLKWWRFDNLFKGDSEFVELHECPACEAKGFLGGQEWDAVPVEDYFSDDPTSGWVRITYVVEEFRCPTCSLHLFGARETGAAELPEEIEKEESREREFEPEYGND